MADLVVGGVLAVGFDGVAVAAASVGFAEIAGIVVADAVGGGDVEAVVVRAVAFVVGAAAAAVNVQQCLSRHRYALSSLRLLLRDTLHLC